MRIRKHARNSAAVHTKSSLPPWTVLQTYVCQLNQSPWDVMSFSPPASPSTPAPSPLPTQVNGSDVCGGNGSLDGRNSLVESKHEVSDKEIKNGDYKKVKEELPKDKNGKVIFCCKSDGKSWHCRREAAQGSSLCEHHLSLSKSYQNSNVTNNAAKKLSESASAHVEPRRSTRSSNKLASSSSDSNEFYFYSGFKPGWSKKVRNIPAGNDGRNNPAGCARNFDHERDPTLSSQLENGVREVGSEDKHMADSDGHEELPEEEEENNGNGKKRVRKPIKARSLKSLM